MLSVENRPLVMTCSTAESPGIIAAKRPWRSGEYARDKDRDAGAGATRSLLSSRWVTTAFAARPIARRAAHLFQLVAEGVHVAHRASQHLHHGRRGRL
jgi:hypothetical protein